MSQVCLWSKLNSKYYPNYCRLFSASCGCWWGRKSQINNHSSILTPSPWKLALHPPPPMIAHWTGSAERYSIHTDWGNHSLCHCPKVPLWYRINTLSKERLWNSESWRRFRGVLMLFCICVVCVWVILRCIKHSTASLLSPLLFIHHTGGGIWQIYRQPLTAVFCLLCQRCAWKASTDTSKAQKKDKTKKTNLAPPTVQYALTSSIPTAENAIHVHIKCKYTPGSDKEKLSLWWEDVPIGKVTSVYREQMRPVIIFPASLPQAHKRAAACLNPDDPR